MHPGKMIIHNNYATAKTDAEKKFFKKGLIIF